MNQNLTTAEAAAVGGLAATFAILGIVFFVLMIIADWRIFKKAGEPGWKSLIPFYNIYIMFKIVGMKGWFWAYFIISIVSGIIIAASGYGSATPDTPVPLYIALLIIFTFIFTIIVDVIYSYRTAKAFRHGLGYTIGLFLLPTIFWFIIAFGKSKYDKSILKK